MVTVVEVGFIVTGVLRVRISRVDGINGIDGAEVERSRSRERPSGCRTVQLR